VAVSYSNLPATLPPVEWRNVRSRMVEAAVSLCKARPKVARAQPSQGGAGEVDLQRLGRQAEVPIRVPSLRIAGQIDLFDRTAESRVTVRDYKTGNVLQADGSLRPEIALQLRLYGIALLELLPRTEVSLVVSAGSDYPVSFTDDDVLATKTW